jgi:hypothetical protein
MRTRTIIGFGLVLVACAETKQDGPTAPTTAAPAEVRYDIETWKREGAPAACGADEDGGAPSASSTDEDAGVPADAGPAPSSGSSDAVVAAIRAHVRPCYDELLAQDPGAHGRLVEQVWLRRDGSVCGVRPTLRIGLSGAIATCFERMVRVARFEGVPSPLIVPLTYSMKRPDGALYGHPARVDLQGCGAKATVATEATLSYASDTTGEVGDLAVDPWKGDQGALECAANMIRKTPHGPSTQFVLRLLFHP